jgi:Fuc2NAc and GlcNAc transferase
MHLWAGGMNLIITVGIGVLSMILTRWIKRQAVRLNLIDIPNHRSSHTQPTPHSGGIGFVISYFVGLTLLLNLGDLPTDLFFALVIGGAGVALVGYLDDLSSLSAVVRLVTHVAAAVWGLYCLGGMPPLDLGVVVWHWGWIGHIVGVIGLTWMINLYNFMDGIDGLAASEAVFVTVFVSALLMDYGAQSIMWASLMLASTCLGFLVWNWPPAKIFMGDVGSGFLGYVLGILALASAAETPRFPLIWLILLGTFVTDTTITLLRRILQHQPFLQAHHNHAYQHAATYLNSHLKVTLAVQAINIVWLGGWTLFCWFYPDLSGVALVFAFLPLIGLTLYLKAGISSRRLRFH